MRRYWLVMPIFIVIVLGGLGLSDQIFGQDKGGPSAVDANKAKNVLRLLGAAGTARQKAAEKPVDLFGPYAAADAAEKLLTETVNAFKGNEKLLTGYFAYSLLLVSQVDSQRGVVCYYNPWVDVALLTNWELRVADEKVTSFVFLPGEMLRGDKLGENPTMPAWLARKGISGERSIAEVTYATVLSAESLYRDVKAFAFPPPVLAEQVAKQRADLLAVCQSRMLFKLGLKEKAFSADDLKTVSDSIGLLQKAIADGRREVLSRALSKEQNRTAIDTITLLPEGIRGTLIPHFYVRSGNKALVFLTSPFAPKFFIAAQLEIGKTDSLPTAVVYDFSVNPKAAATTRPAASEDKPSARAD